MTKGMSAWAVFIVISSIVPLGCDLTESSDTDQILPIMSNVRDLWSHIEMAMDDCVGLIDEAEERYKEKSDTFDIAQEYYLESSTVENEERFDNAVLALTEAANRVDDIVTAYNRASFASAKVMFLSNDITYALNVSTQSMDVDNAPTVLELQAEYALTKAIVSAISCE